MIKNLAKVLFWWSLAILLMNLCSATLFLLRGKEVWALVTGIGAVVVIYPTVLFYWVAHKKDESLYYWATVDRIVALLNEGTEGSEHNDY